MQNPRPRRFLGGPHCPHHRLPTGTEGRTLDQAEEEQVEGETEQVFGSRHFSLFLVLNKFIRSI